MKLEIKISRLLILVGFIICPLLAKSQIYSFSEFNTRSGLPNLQINDITQDSVGYLWIATQGGISRFNGQKFINYTTDDGLVSNKCISIYVDKKQRVWVGTEDGLSVFENGKFRNLSSENGLLAKAILSFDEGNDEMFAATNNGGVKKIVMLPDTFLVNTIGTADGLIADFIFDVFLDKYGRLWVAELAGVNIVEFVDSTFRVSNIHQFALMPSSEYYIDITEDDKGNIWLSTRESGVFEISNYKDLPYLKIKNIKKDDGLNHNTVVSIQCTQKGDVWFATYNGLNRYHEDKILSIGNDNGLKYSQILKVFEDRDKNIWIGTGENGLLKYLGDQFVKYYIPKAYNRVINDVISTSKNLIVSDESGLYKIAPNGNKIKVIKRYDKLKDYVTNITSIDIDKKGSLWIGTNQMGLIELTADNVFHRYTELHNQLASNTVYSVKTASDGSIYIGTSGGYSKYDGSRFQSVKVSQGLINNLVTCIIEDNEKNIWMGTNGGLVELWGKNYSDFNEEDGLSDLKITTLACDYMDNVWIGTENGAIFIFNKKSKTGKPIKQFSPTQLNLLDVQSLQFANKFTLIATSSNGFTRLHFNKNYELLEQKFYSAEHGFTDGKVKPNAICKDTQSHIWIATTDGLYSYRPNLETMSLRPPTIDLDKIEVDRKPLPKNNLKTKLYKGNRYLELPHSISRIEFFADGGSLNQPYPVKYSYYCEGIDKDWIPPTDRADIPYNRPSPGYYIFNIKAIDKNGIWSEPISYRFRIKPPFTQTWWFITLMIILGFIAVYLYMKYRTRKLILERDKLERVVQLRTHEIQQQRDIVTQKNKEIEDSINYAQRIQQALLDVSDRISNSGFEHFIFFRPRDIVSGDFYWSNGSDTEPIITVADSTGHGVPGAFMSLLGINYLNRIVNEMQITRPNEILDQLRERIIHALQQEAHPISLRDGMDMTLIKIVKEQNKLYCAGAFNSLFVVRKDELIETKVDRFGVAVSEEIIPFSLYELDLQDEDVLYMYTDGYKDQFGGPNEKKINSKQFKNLLIEIHGLSMEDQNNRLAHFLDEWKEGYDQIDDICVMGIRYKKLNK